MLRTNSKQARANIRAYIMTDSDYIAERLLFDDESRYLMEDDTPTEAEACRAIWEFFKEEKRYELATTYKTHKTMRDIFTEWAQGLACGGLFDYYYNVSAVQVLGDILEETEAERSKYTEEQAERLLTYLIFKEVSR